MQILLAHPQLPAPPLCELARDLPAQRPHLAFQIPQTGLAGIVANHRKQRLIRQFQPLVRQPVFPDLPGRQKLPGNLQLLRLGIAGKLQHLHPVQQRRRDGMQGIGRRNKQHIGKVELHIQVVIHKTVVLLGVQHLQQRRRGIAPEIRPQLVDLVQHKHRIVRPRPAQPLNNPSRQRAHVGTAVPTHLRLVPHAAQGNPHKLTAHSPSDRTPQGRLARPRRTCQAEDGPPHIVLEPPDRQILQDAFLGLLQAVVILVQDALGLVHIQMVIGRQIPGQIHQPVQISPGNRVLGRRLRHLLHP